jgi:hypothetical protein
VNGKIRYDVLHLFGTEEMSTDDVKRFFDTYDPHYKLEWVSDSACNIVFDSNSVAKDAYETYGIRGIPFDPEVAAKLTEEERRYLQWRECGRFHLKAFTGLFVRYAVEGDRKERRAAEKSQYYKKHGRVVEDNKEDTVVDLRQTLERKRSEVPSDSGQGEDDLRSEIALVKKRKTHSDRSYDVKGDLREDLRKQKSTSHHPRREMKPSLKSRLGPYT